MTRFSLLIASSLTAFGGPALAQNSVPAQPLPGLDSFSLPSSRPPPRVSPSPEPTTNPQPVETETVAPPAVVPTVRTTATPRATATPVRPTPTARATPAPERTPAPQASATPTPAVSAVPVVAPSPVASLTPTVAPTPQASAAATAEAAPAASASAWLWRADGGGLALIVAIGFGLWWRQRGAQDVAVYDDDHVVAPDAFEPPAVLPAAQPAAEVVVPAPVPLAEADKRAWVVFELTPKRAGTNLLSAAVEYLIVLRNTGDVAATGIRLDIRLLSVGAQQDAAIDAMFAAPIAQPITAPFDLPAGVAVELGGMALHPKATLETMEAGGKAVFVPVLAVNAVYDWAGGSGQTANSYVIGIDRGAGGKLAPFRIDSGARMYDTVRAIEYTVPA